MKKSLILLSICSAVLLTSCGTSSYYASSSFEDGIYYRPSQESRAKVEADNAEVRRLIEQTRQEAARFSDTIVIASANSTLDVSYTPDTQYTIMFDDQLDSLGQLNLNFNFDDWYPCYGYRDYYSYWDWRYWNVFGPSWHRWGWYNSWYWGWYDPWYWSWGIGFAWDPWYGPWGWFGPGYWGPGYWGWYDPWYCGWGFGFGLAWDPWYGPWGGWYAGWYGPGYWGWYDPWYDPWYGPWGYPVASFYPTYAYYGKRNTGLRTGSGVTGGRTLASAGGSSLRSGGRKAAPTMSVVRGSASSGRSTASGRTFQARPTGSGSSVNMGERYVNRGSVSTVNPDRQGTLTRGRTAYGNSTAGNSSFRRASSGAASGFRRASSSGTSFRNPFENRSYNNPRISTGISRDFDRSFNRSEGINRQTTINRNTYNSNSSRSFSTGRSISRSSMSGGRTYSGGGSRSGGGRR